jgi:hypothetical protein
LELFPAFIAHAVPGRVRIKIPGKRGDGLFFAKLEASLQACADVQSVQVNERLGSILITQGEQSNIKDIANYARSHKLFGLRGEEALPLPSAGEIFLSQLQKTDRLFRQADQMIATGTRGKLDMQSMFFLLFLGLGIKRAWRSHLLEPDVPLLWRVVEIFKGF